MVVIVCLGILPVSAVCITREMWKKRKKKAQKVSVSKSGQTIVSVVVVIICS